jgi:undecaprenyl-phosphate 4-deoxy-4-formamido-L-arabinose transferase
VQPIEPYPEDPRLPEGVSVVIPCFNCEGTIESLVEQLAQVLPRSAERYEAILVNDGSADGTWRLIRELSGRYPWIVGMNLMRNYGQHNATLAGARQARFAVTVTLDDDLQHPPAEMPKILAKLAEGHDLVYGVPQQMTQTLYRDVLSWLIRWAIAVASRQRMVQEISAYRAFRTSLRRAFADYRSPQVFFDIVLAWGTTKIDTTPVVHQRRTVGTSNYGLFHLINVALLMWTGYTTAPLRLASIVGFTFVTFGAGVLAYVVILYFMYGSLPGCPFLASTIAIFGGVQLFTLGIIGEYLARMFNRSLDQPVYVIEGLVTAKEPSAPATPAGRSTAD